jgi:hypothetical protein
MVRAARAKGIIIVGDWYSEENLYVRGMMNRGVAPELLMELIHEIASRLVTKNRHAVAASKLSVNAVAAVALRDDHGAIGLIHPYSGYLKHRGSCPSKQIRIRPEAACWRWP